MAISQVFSSVGSQANGASVVLALTGAAAGDVVVAFGGKPHRAAGSIGPPSALGYTVQAINESAAPNWGVWTKYMGNTVDSSVALLGSGSSLDGTSYGVYVFRGVASVVTDATTTVAGPTTSTNPDCPQITTLTQSTWIVALAGSAVLDTAITSILGYSSLIQTSADDNNDISTAGNLKSSVASGTENPGSYNDWASGAWYAATLALRDLNQTPPASSVPTAGQLLLMGLGS